VIDWIDIVEFNRDCNKWEAILKSHCCTTEEQKVISDCFTRMRDRFKTTRLRMTELNATLGVDK